LVAIPNLGYFLRDWTEAGSVISTDPSFTLTLTSNRTITANFVDAGPPHIYTFVSPFDAKAGIVAGSVTGAGEYVINDVATLEATANAGYVFKN
jgi:hypothetical protein